MAAELGTSFNLDHALQYGLLPLVINSVDIDDALQSYVALYVKEEVQMEGQVRNIGNFSRFLEAVSFSHGSVLSISEVSRECEVGRKTVEGFINILEDILLSFRIPVFSKRAKRKLIKHPIFYFFDAGIFRSLRPSGPLDTPSEIGGSFLEGLVAQHIRAWNAYSGNMYTLSFWRTKSGVEVDFVVYGDGGLWAVEVKNKNNIHSKDLKGLRTFMEDYPGARAFLLYRGEDKLRIKGIPCLPCSEFLKGLQPGQSFDAGVF